MKKILMLLSSIALLLVSCSETTHDNVAERVPSAKSNKIRWYGTKLPDGVQTRGVADADKRWNQDGGIYIKFLNSPAKPEMLSKVKAIAKEWEEYAGIQFNFVEADKKTSVRIAFDYNGNDELTWAYTGTDAKSEKNQNKPTAVFGGLDDEDEEVFRGDILRVFGQILGLEYEQRHQEWAKNGYWKSETQLQKYWENQFDGLDMDWDEIREYVFVPLTESNATVLMQSKAIDEESIMAWPHYLRKQTSHVISNFELSEGDKTFIATLYPKDKQKLPTIQEAWVDAGYFVWRTKENTPSDKWKEGMVALEITELGVEQEYLPDVCDGEQLTSAYSMFVLSYPYYGGNYPLRLKTCPKFNTSNITDFSYMFDANIYVLVPQYHHFGSLLTTIPELDTSKGTDFTRMFSGCFSLTSVPDLDTSNGTNFGYMFYDCRSLTSIPDLDTSNGTNFTRMFQYCSSLTSVPDLDTSNETNFEYMFSGCRSLTSIPDLDTSNGTDFRWMFSVCRSLTSIPLLDTSKGTDFRSMFSYCASLTSIPDLDTSNGTHFGYMFSGCSSLISLPDLDTSNGMNFRWMFSNCTALQTKP